MDKLLILFVKYPVPGQVKTRLGKDIGFKKAARLYERLVKHQLRDLHRPDYDLVVCADPGHALTDYQEKFGSRQLYWQQEGRGLGERMANAFAHAFNLGYSRVLLMGSDIPLVDAKGIRCFFALLETGQAVIGPALDGGYYLIGFKNGTDFYPLFNAIPWSTAQVFEKTMEKGAGLKIRVGKTWFDLDTAADLKQYDRLKAAGKSFSNTDIRIGFKIT